MSSRNNKHRPALVALVLTAGLLAWWAAFPPAVLGGGDRSGIRHLSVAALLVGPLALLAAAVAGRLNRGRGGLPPLVRAAAAAGLLAGLLLVTAPAQVFAHNRLVPAPIEPNLAAIGYDATCPSMLSGEECADLHEGFAGLDSAGLERSHHAMMAITGETGVAHTAALAPFMPAGGGVADPVTRAVGDASVALLVALPLAALGVLLARLLPALPQPPPRRRNTWFGRVRSRRTAVASTVGLVVAANLVLTSASAAAAVTPFSVPLKIPPVLRGSQVTLQMRQSNVQIMPTGPATRMWTYNGDYPGPTIRRPSGTVTRVTFQNNLPAEFGQATIHHHGSHSRPSEDGQPNDFLVPNGGQRTYSYEHFEAGENERAVTQWYHDHRMDVTGRNVWNGLAGMFILDDAFDSALPLPKGEFDVPLIISDRTFDANNQIPYTFNIVGTLGDTWLVNGRPQPFFNVGDRKYRVRILNAANRRPLVLGLSNGAPITQIATDSGLLPAPIQRSSIIIQPAERVEVVLDFAGMLGQQLVLLDTNTPATPGNPPKELIRFDVNRDLTETSSVPATLRPVPTLPAPTVDRKFVITSQNDANGNLASWRINGQLFDSARIDADPVLNSTERWTFMNNSPQPHAIHLHDVDWRLLSRFQLAFDAAGNPIQGAAIPVQPYDAALKETFFLPAGTGMQVSTKFTDHVGKYVFHCHMLEHEDMAMMATFNVRAA